MSNCIIFAVMLYLRRVRKGREGYLIMRGSRLALKSPHLLYAERRANGSMRLVSYCPTVATRRALPPPLFAGRVRWGD